MSELERALQEDTSPPPPYIIFVVVFLFFVMGLCGFLFCHMLKMKGYRCTMEEDEEDEELEEEQDDDNEEHQDTVEQILKCIIENEANMDAFNEMLGKGNVCVRHDPRLRKESIGGLPPHMHTVHSGSDPHNTCHLCAQSRSKRGRRLSRTPRFRQRPGEQTVFAVGRFRVTHTDKKSADSGKVPEEAVGSGDYLDQFQDSEERRDGGYNLRNLFKDVRPVMESPSSMAPSAGKRRRSLTLFGLRRGSDPINVKVVSTGKEGVRFIPQPVVLEETQNGNGENLSKQVSILRRESLEIAASQVKESSKATGSKAQSKHLITVESSNLQTTVGTVPVTYPPNSFPVPFTSSPQSSSPAAGRDTDHVQLSPPLQTSTPLTLLPNPGEMICQFAAETNIPPGIQGSQTPPDPCTSPVLELSSLPSPVLISLGSSPHVSTRTTTSPLVANAKVSSQPVSIPEPNESPRSLDSMASLQISSPSLSLQDGNIPVEMTNQDPSFKSVIRQTKLESPSTQRSMPELKNLAVHDEDNSSPKLFDSSPLESRISSVSIIKASPDSNREFSVVTMLDKQMGASKADVEQPLDIGKAEMNWTSQDEKEEMVEMEEIAECRVTQAKETN